MTLIFHGQQRRECLGLLYSFVCMEESPAQCWSKHKSKGGLNTETGVLHTSLCWWLLASLRPKASVLASKEWVWIFCCWKCTQLWHSWPELPGQMRGRDCVFPLRQRWEGADISILPYRRGRRECFEHSLRLRLHQQNRCRDQELEIAQILLSIWFLAHRWAVSDIKSRHKSHLQLSSPQCFPSVNREWFGGLIFG